MKRFIKKIPLIVFFSLFLFTVPFSPNDSGSNLKADTRTDDLYDWCWAQCVTYGIDAADYWSDMMGLPHSGSFYESLIEENFSRCYPHCTYIGWIAPPAPAFG